MRKSNINTFLKEPIIFLYLTFLYLELLIQIAIIHNMSWHFVYVLLFDFSLAFFVGIFTTIWKKKINKIIYTIIFILLSLYFCVQILYYDFFKVFFTVYSLGNGGQIAEFYQDILQLLLHNIHWIFLSFTPFILYVTLFRKKICFKRIHDKKFMISFCLSIISFVMAYTCLYLPSQSLNSPLEVYQDTSMNETTVQEFGMLTALRLDIQSLFMSKDDTEPVVNSQPKPQEIVYPVQTMDIDFDHKIAKSPNNTIKNMHRYFQSITPTKKNKYTGMFKGYNMILLTCEGFSPYAINKDVTPTLYRLYNEGFQFKNFYTPLWHVSTSDGEYVAMQGLIPKSGAWSFRQSSQNELPLTLGKQFQKMGYTTQAYHNHSYTYYSRNKSHPNLGYKFKANGHGLKMKKQWPESDLEMMQKTVDEYINEKHFHTYYMTVSGHTNYTFTGNSMAYKNKKYVKDLKYSDLAKGYLATQIELDRALEYLIKRLEKAGIADKTLIALSADHYPYGLPNKNYNELAGHKLEKNFELYKNSFLVWSGSMKEAIVVDKAGSSLDILPTLSNLLGLEYDSRLLMGTDILSDSEPLVIFANKSFITDKVMYNAKTNQAKWLNGQKEDLDYLKKIHNVVKQKFKYSAQILDNNYYKYVFNESS